MDIVEELGVCELLCGLAEEASELSQAALKLRRAIDNKNPTPKTCSECCYNINEEIADCELILELLGFREPDILQVQDKIKKQKKARWISRLEMNKQKGE